MRGLAKALLAVAGLALAGCSQDDPRGRQVAAFSEPVFHAETNPERLSEWNLVRIAGGELALNDRVVPYDLNSALFTDYAHKLRTVWLPKGRAAQYSGEDTFDFPVGTVISKTFYYPRGESDNDSGQRIAVSHADDTTSARLANGFSLADIQLIETRLLIRREQGWVALPYVWNEDQSDAVLKRTGDAKPMRLTMANGTSQDFTYIVPNANQCAGCHATNATTRAIQPIGPKARHLNRQFAYPGGSANQLDQWATLGILTGMPDSEDAPRSAVWDDGAMDLRDRARAYLDINCAHCHNRNGPADTSGLLLEHDAPLGPSLGLCKLPIAAGKGTGGRSFGIVPGEPGDSIFTYRMESTDPSIMMPELGRALADDAGAALIAEWIASLEGACG